MSISPQDESFGGIELASELIRSENAILMASLVQLEEGPGVELALCSIGPEGIGAPRIPLVFLAEDVHELRTMAEVAVQQLPAANYDDEAAALLAQDGDAIATAIRAPAGELFTVGWADGSEVTYVPAADAPAIVRVLAAAQHELAELGVVRLPSGVIN